MQTANIEGFRLSPQQTHLWLVQLSSASSRGDAFPQATDSVPYTAHGTVLIKGTLDIGHLEAALSDVVQRHEMLRTTFQTLPAMTVPLQVISDQGIIPLAQTEWQRDFSSASVQADALNHWNGHITDAQDALLATLAKRAAKITFDLTQGPLLQASLVRLAATQHLLHLHLPALCVDAKGLANLVQEISRSYAVQLGIAAPDDDPIQYADLAEWQNGLLEAEDAAPGKAYWQACDLSALRTVRLPFAKPLAAVEKTQHQFQLHTYRPQIDTQFDSSQLDAQFDRIQLAAEWLAQAEAVAEDYGVDLPLLLLAGWQLLLWRLTGQTNIGVGVAYDGRHYAELQDAIGLFAKYLPIVAQISPDLSLADLLAQLAEASHNAATWQECFVWEQLDGQAAAAAGRTAVHYAPFCFEFGETPDVYCAGDSTFTIVQQATYIDRFHVRLSTQRSTAGLAVTFDYDAALYAAGDMERLADQYVALLHSIVSTPEPTVGNLTMVSAQERAQLLVVFNQTATNQGDWQPVHCQFAHWAAATPHAPAGVVEATQISYGELNRRANQLAHHLQRLGVGAESLVGLCAERSVELLVGLLGILKAGGAYVPLDPLLPTERLAAMLADAQPQVLLTQQQLLAHLPPTDAQLLCLDRDWPTIAQESAANPDSQVAPENLVYVLFTSGSTGRPKGVGVTHGNLANYVQAVAQRLALPAGASYATVSTVAADLGNTAIFPALCSGGCLHVVAQARLTDPAAFADYFQQHAIDCLKIVPSHLAALLAAGRGAAVLPRGAFGARLVLGGEALPPALVQQVQQLAPDLHILNHYGPTETTVGVLTNPVTATCPTDHASMPLGRPLDNVQAYVLDEGMRNPVPTWAAGELYIGGAQVTRGYLHRPDQTAERFVPDPFSTTPGARLYRTGDRVRHLPEGAIAFLGRVDHQIKLRGFRIELGEIEAALRAQPGISTCAVEVREDGGSDGGDGPRLIAYVVPEPGTTLSMATLRQGLQSQLPDYMLPTAFVKLDALPLTANGKLDRRALPTPSPTLMLAQESADFVAPRTPVEEMVASVWAQVLGVEQIGATDDFFALGGHSLLVTRVAGRIASVFQVELPFRLFFEKRTVAELADAIVAAQRGETNPGDAASAPPLQPIEHDGELPLSFAQQRLWFFDQLVPNSPAYNIPGAVRLQGVLDVAALERTLTEIVRRHAILRTTFPTVNGKPHQSIHAPAPIALAVTDLRPLPPAAREAEALRLAKETAHQPFALAQGPLLRVGLLQMADQEHVLCFTLHHMVGDAWSLALLVQEVATLYAAFTAGKDAASTGLAELPVQYVDFAHWQRQWLQGARLAEQVAYWKQQLANAPQGTELPTDKPRPAVQRYTGDWAPIALAPALSGGIRQLSRSEGNTLFMTLLAAFGVLLRHYTKQDDLIIGTNTANRTHHQTEKLIGFFVNQLVLRIDLSGDPTFRDVLGRVRAVALGAYAHQELPFEKLVEELQPVRDPSRSLLFQIKFEVQEGVNRTLELPNLTITPLDLDHVVVRHDLHLFMSAPARGGALPNMSAPARAGALPNMSAPQQSNEDRLAGTLLYNSELFHADTIKRILRDYETLLAILVEQPDLRLHAVDELLTEKLRQEQQVTEQALAATSVQKLKGRKRQAVSV